MILDNSCSLTKPVVRHFHEATLHGGGQLVLNALPEEFWIVKEIYVNRVLKQCVKCVRFSLKETEQRMGNLPRERILPFRPFTPTELDSAGPLIPKTDKTYVVVFFASQQSPYISNWSLFSQRKPVCVL